MGRAGGDAEHSLGGLRIWQDANIIHDAVHAGYVSDFRTGLVTPQTVPGLRQWLRLNTAQTKVIGTTAHLTGWGLFSRTDLPTLPVVTAGGAAYHDGTGKRYLDSLHYKEANITRGAWCIYVVATVHSAAPSHALRRYDNPVLFGDSAALLSQNVHEIAGVPQSHTFSNYAGGAGYKYTPSIPIAYGTKYVFEFRKVGVDSFNRVNGVETSVAGDALIYNAASNWRLFATGLSASYYNANATIDDVLVYAESPSDVDRAAIRSYLGTLRGAVP